MKQGAKSPVTRAVRYELRFPSLSEGGSGLAFPCDADGNVNIAELSERCRSNYFFARKAIGHELSAPVTVIAE